MKQFISIDFNRREKSNNYRGQSSLRKRLSSTFGTYSEGIGCHSNWGFHIWIPLGGKSPARTSCNDAFVLS